MPEDRDRGVRRDRVRSAVAWTLAGLSLALLDLAAWIHPQADRADIRPPTERQGGQR